MTRAVLFDLFGTIIGYRDVAEGNDAGWRGIFGVCEELGLVLDYGEFVARWEGQIGEPVGPDGPFSGETVFVRKLLRLFDSLALPLDAQAAHRAADACLAAWGDHVYLPADSIPALQEIRARMPIALVSNFDHPPYVHDLLQQLGLTHLFQHISISGEVGYDKPDPRIFERALDALGVRPEDAVFVGDSLHADIEGSAAVGCRPVLIDRQRLHTQYAGERVADISELVTLLL